VLTIENTTIQYVHSADADTFKSGVNFLIYFPLLLIYFWIYCLISKADLNNSGAVVQQFNSHSEHFLSLLPRPICGRTYSEPVYRVLYGEVPYSVPVRRALHGEDHQWPAS
jgi:hypothetical protein